MKFKALIHLYRSQVYESQFCFKSNSEALLEEALKQPAGIKPASFVSDQKTVSASTIGFNEQRPSMLTHELGE